MDKSERVKINIRQNLKQFNVVDSIIRRTEACITSNLEHFEPFL